jgi:hypothetical protein
VDFDGVICQSVYPGLGPLIDGAKEALQLFKSLGFTIIISSCRSCSWNWDTYYKGQPVTHASERKVYQDMIEFLQTNGIPYDVIDDGTKGKVSADYYIDDKGIRFSNNWPDLAFLIHQAEVQDRVQQYQQAQQAQAQQSSQPYTATGQAVQGRG